jgi:hypothetical protein
MYLSKPAVNDSDVGVEYVRTPEPSAFAKGIARAPHPLLMERKHEHRVPMEVVWGGFAVAACVALLFVIVVRGQVMKPDAFTDSLIDQHSYLVGEAITATANLCALLRTSAKDMDGHVLLHVTESVRLLTGAIDACKLSGPNTKAPAFTEAP